jgi:hypothetical protein
MQYFLYYQNFLDSLISKKPLVFRSSALTQQFLCIPCIFLFSTRPFSLHPKFYNFFYLLRAKSLVLLYFLTKFFIISCSLFEKSTINLILFLIRIHSTKRYLKFHLYKKFYKLFLYA